MSYDNALTASKLRRWEKYLHEYRLPKWEDIPNFGLYMEQVLELLTEYLDYLPPELKEEQFITAATINNYVRNKYMPEPRRKKYYRVHLAYLIMICTLKQSLSIATIQKMVPVNLSEEEVQLTYSAYVRRHQITSEYFIEQVRMIAGPLLEHENADCSEAVGDTRELIAVCAIMGGLSKLLAEKLLLLDGYTIEDIRATEHH